MSATRVTAVTAVPAVLAATALALCTRDWEVDPAPGLDQSWQLGLHLWSRGAADGVPIAFTYGPLGFLAVPTNWVRATAVLAVLVTLLVQILLSAVLLRALRRRDRLLLGLLPGWLVLVLGGAGGAGLTLGLLAFAVAVERLTSTRAPGRGEPWLMGLAVGLVVLVKPGTGLVALAVLGVAAVATAGPALRTRALAGLALVAGTGAAVVAGWALSGQALSRLPSWLKASVELARGYEAMSIEEPGRSWEYAAAAVGIVAVLALWAACTEVRRAWALLLVGVFLYLELKHGFVRHDAHASGFFVAILLAALLVPGSRARVTPGLRGALASTVQVLAVVLLVAVRTPVGSLPTPLAALRSAVAEAHQLGSREQWDADREVSRHRLQAAYPVSAEVLGAVGDGVQVDPWDTALVYAYDLPWHPVPVFQHYSAYTPWLDEHNAAAVRSPSAPPQILRSLTLPSIDGRNPIFDSPGYQLEVACRYRATASDAEWQLLTRTVNRCGAPIPLSRVEAVGDAAVPIPAARIPGSAVVARVHAHRPLLDGVWSLLLKSPADPRVCLDQACYRLVPETAGGPLLVRKAAWMAPGPVGSDTAPATLRLKGIGSDAVVEFFEIPAR